MRNNESISQRVVAQLRKEIFNGDIAPGSRLSQSKLAASLGVSRIPVRDALQQLVSEGLVDSLPDGAVARSMSIVELQELHEMREAIEPLVTRLAVPNVGRAQIIRMTSLLETMGNTQNVDEWLRANADFHAAIYHQADRPRMIALVDQLRKLTDRYLYLHLAVIGNVEHLQQEHTQILEAVKAGDAEGLARETHNHLETSHYFILNYLLENATDQNGELVLTARSRPSDDTDPAAGGA